MVSIPIITHLLQFPIGMCVVMSCGTNANRQSAGGPKALWTSLVLVGRTQGEDFGFLRMYAFSSFLWSLATAIICPWGFFICRVEGQFQVIKLSGGKSLVN